MGGLDSGVGSMEDVVVGGFVNGGGYGEYYEVGKERERSRSLFSFRR